MLQLSYGIREHKGQPTLLCFTAHITALGRLFPPPIILELLLLLITAPFSVGEAKATVRFSRLRYHFR